MILSKKEVCYIVEAINDYLEQWTTNEEEITELKTLEIVFEELEGGTFKLTENDMNWIKSVLNSYNSDFFGEYDYEFDFINLLIERVDYEKRNSKSIH